MGKSNKICRHNMQWIMAVDFNEPLVEEDNFGGRSVSINRSLLFKDV